MKINSYFIDIVVFFIEYGKNSLKSATNQSSSLILNGKNGKITSI